MSDSCCEIRDTKFAGKVHQWNCPEVSLKAVRVPGEHYWIAFRDSAWASCLWCGIIHGKEEPKPCNGPVRVGLR